MSIERVVRKYKIDQEPNNFSYWKNKSFQERIDALETIRSEYHAWRYSDAEQRFHRVCRIVKQKQGELPTKYCRFEEFKIASKLIVAKK
jgi:hypothetical protein